MAPKKKQDSSNKNQQQQPKPKKSKAQEEEELLRQFEKQSKAQAQAAKSGSGGGGGGGKAQEHHMTQEERAAARKAKAEEERKAQQAAAEREFAMRQLQMQQQLREQQERARLQQNFESLKQQGLSEEEAIQQMMSPILTTPKTELEVEETPAAASPVVNEAVVVSCQGWRKNMEDAHVLQPKFNGESDNLSLFAVFDGHAGDVAAKMCSQLIPLQILMGRKKHGENSTDTKILGKVLAETFIQLDEKMYGKIKDDSGCTAVAALITPTHVVVASVGDSRAVLCRGGKAFPLAQDHKPENPDERKRIEAAGGHVENNRTNGELAMSRALGDFRYKRVPNKGPNEQLVIAVPDVHVIERRKGEDNFLMVACDGVFDVHSNDECAEKITALVKAEEAKSGDDAPKDKALRRATETFVRSCVSAPLRPGAPENVKATDNVTCVVVRL